jgi:hypothetical protein
MIGRHQCKQAHKTDLKGAIAIGLDEVLTALEEAFYDLSDEQMRAFPIRGRNNVAWIVMHALQNLDEFTNVAHGGRPTFEHDRRWDLWACRDDERPKPGDRFPAQTKMIGWLKSLRATAQETLGRMDEPGLHRKPDGTWPGVVADMYMRTIWHTVAHTRQIWLLRGALGLTDGKSWPQQHWA